MKPRDPKARSREALRQAMDRYGRENAESAARGGEPWPGDLYVLDETAGVPVEWLVVERTPGHCRLVAADTNPALGSADVPVPAEIQGGPLTVRCAVSFQVRIEVLRSGERTGSVAPEILEPVRQRLEELAAGALAPRSEAGEEPDPGLEDWLDEVLVPARAALHPPGRKAPGPLGRFGRRAAGVAVLLLLVALGSVSALAWRSEQQERQAHREVARLVQERRQLEAEHQRQLEALRQAKPLRPPAPSPPAPPPPAREPLRTPVNPLVNLAWATFYPGEARGDQREITDITVPGGSTHLFLLFYVGHQQEPCKEYGLEITRRGASEPALTVRELRPLSGQEVSVAVPRAKLPDGSYQLRLYDVCKGERREPVGTYGIRLKEDT
jgi:hypothetical protein